MKSTYTGSEVRRYLRLIRRLTALCALFLVTTVVMTVLYFTKPTDKVEVENESSNAVADSSNTADAENNGASGIAGTAESGSASSKTQSSEKITVSSNDLGKWNLQLVSAKSPLPENFSIETAKIKSQFARDEGMSFDARAVDYLNNMCEAAAKEDVTLLVISCYRPHYRQESLFENELADVKAENPGISEADAVKKASTVVAYPGTSEHEVGLAVDFNSVLQTFEHTKQFQWLSAHAAEYGFVLRYPKDKESVTGIVYEPWHYRYVGVEHAKNMNSLGMCLEEYTEYLEKIK